MRSRHVDVIVVGYGPVGAMAAVLLRQRGLSVAVIDRERDVYPLPRAAIYDGEIARVFQNAGLQDAFRRHVTPLKGAGFRGGEGQALGPDLLLPEGYAGAQGHPENVAFHQPLLEGGMRARAEALGVETWLGFNAGPPSQEGSSVSLTATPVGGGEPVRFEAAWLVAADGASSGIRKHLGITWDSLGYDRDWLVMDVILTDGDAALPEIVLQVCDPKRIHAFVPMCGPRRRWEFILNPGETRADMMTEAKQWELLDRYLTPNQARIERAAAYQFHAAIASKLSVGRIFLVGDAAHQTPPFLGQGMCTGIRDVANLAWKIDAVHRGRMPERLLATYDSERRPHALDTVDHAVAVGRLIDAFAEAQVTGNWPTDMSALYSGGRGRVPLAEGIFAEATGRPSDRVAGTLAPQPFVHAATGQALLDDVFGTGFRIISSAPIAAQLKARQREFLDVSGVTTIELSGERRASPQLDSWLQEFGAIVVRPDHYVFGAADAERPIGALLDELAAYFQR